MTDMRFFRRAAIVAVAGAAAFGLGSAAFGQTVTDPTGSVSVGVPAGGGGSNADGSVLAVAVDGCARSGLVGVSVNVVAWPPSCPWGTPGSAQGPIALGNGETRGTVSVSAEEDAYGMCWNPVAIGCLPSVAFTYDGDANGGTVSIGLLGGWDGCSAYDWGPVPGVAVCSTSAHNADEPVTTGSIAVDSGSNGARGRYLAYSGGERSPWDNNSDYASADHVAVSEWDNAYGGNVAVSTGAEAHSGAGGIAVAPAGCSTDPGYYADGNAFTGPGGVSVAGCEAKGGAVAVAVGDATTSSGGLVAVSATGDASGGSVANIDTE